MLINWTQNTNVDKITVIACKQQQILCFFNVTIILITWKCQWVFQLVDMVESVLKMDSHLEEGVVGLYLDVIMKVKLYFAYLL